MSVRSIALAGVAAIAASPALGAAARTDDDARLRLLEQQLQDVQQQLSQLRARRDDDTFNTLSDLKRGASAQYDDINARLDRNPKASIDNGRFTIVSPDGALSLSLRSLIQFDYGYFAQGRGPASLDLNSGSNFRRAQFGFTGTAWKDWS